MEVVVLLCRYVLAVVLTVSGASKLLDRAGTRAAVQSFGVPPRALPVVALLLAPVELSVAGLLLADATGRTGAVAALCLLLVLTAVVVANLAAGRRPSCACFGRLGSSDISSRTVVRNVVLGLLAVVGASASGDAREMVVREHGWSGSAAVVTAALLLAAVLLTVESGAARRDAVRRNEEADQAFASSLADRAAPGSAPAFVLASLAGQDTALGDLLDDRRDLLLTFLSPGCGPCKRLRPAAARWSEAFAGRLRVAVVASGTIETNRKAFAGSPLTVLLDPDARVAAAFGVTSRPSAVLLSPGGQLRTPVAAGETAVRRLLALAVSGEGPRLDAAATPPEAPPASLTLASAPTPRPTVALHLDDAGAGSVVTEHASGTSVCLDALGTLVWQCLDGESRVEDIVRDLAEAFRAPHEQVADDVLRLLHELGGQGLLVGVAATAVSAGVPGRP